MPAKKNKQNRQATVKKDKKAKGSGEVKHASQKPFPGACNDANEGKFSLLLNRNVENRGRVKLKSVKQQPVKKDVNKKRQRQRAPSKSSFDSADDSLPAFNKSDSDRSFTVLCCDQARRQQPCKQPYSGACKKEEEDKCPLFNTWELYCLHYLPKLKWNECTKKLASVPTVEQFWRLYHYLKTPGEMKSKHTFYYLLIKEGYSPDNQSRSNKQGGKWMASIPQGNSPDWYWQELQLMAIGREQKAITGCVIRIKNERGERKFTVELWVRDLYGEGVMEVGEEMRDALKLQVKLFAHHKKSDGYGHIKQLRYSDSD